MTITLDYDTPEGFAELYANLPNYLKSDRSKARGKNSIAVYKRSSQGPITSFKVTAGGNVIGSVL